MCWKFSPYPPPSISFMSKAIFFFSNQKLNILSAQKKRDVEKRVQSEKKNIYKLEKFSAFGWEIFFIYLI